MDTKHPDEGTLYAYVEEQLPAAEHSRIEAHVSGCMECASLVAEARGLIAAASGIVRALDSIPANVVPPRRARRPSPQWLAAAAVVLLAAGVSSVAIRSGTDSGPEALATAADAAAEVQQQPDLDVRGSSAAEADVVEKVAASVSVASPRTPSSSGNEGVSRSTTATEGRDATRMAAGREERKAFSGTTEFLVAPPSPPVPAAGRAASDAASAGIGARAPASAAAAPGGEIVARAQDVTPGTATRSLRQQETTITGRVMTEDGKPLPGANVFINSLNISVGTDANGRYALVVPPGQVQGQSVVIRARAFGYSTESQQMTLSPLKQVTDFELRPTLVELSEGSVVAGGPAVAELREAPISDATSKEADSLSARNAQARALRHQVETRAPMRVTRYEVSRGLIVELREFHALVPVPPAQPGANEFRWTDAAGTRRYVLSGPLAVAELERLARRLGELRVVR
ncbi:hypothetical protein BH23GEM2_BH23GEM2_01240 [soil metagenome]